MPAQRRDWANQGYTKIADNIWESTEGIHFAEIEGILRNITNLSVSQAQRVGVTPEQLKASTNHNVQVLEEAKKRQAQAGQQRLQEPPAASAPATEPLPVKKENGQPQPPEEEHESEHVDAEIIPPKEGIDQDEVKTLALLQHSAIVEPAVPVNEMVKSWNKYAQFTKLMLQKGDYQNIRGKMFKKKSAWRKYEVFFNLSVPMDTVRMIQQTDDQGRVIKAEVWLEMVAPNGRRSPGWAACSLSERAHGEDKTHWDERQRAHVVDCKGPCDGRPHFSHPEHDIPATAMTRARNRACADMIGAGEVSAEEVV
jgi:hypothetical protein